MQVTWAILKGFAVNRQLSIQYIDLGDSYDLKAFDGYFQLSCNLSKDGNEDVIDFENNFKAAGNKKIGLSTDSENATIQRLKMAPAGWTYQLRATEIETSKLGSLVNETCYGVPINDCTLKFYNSAGTELLTQELIDIECVRTVMDFEPLYSYEVIGGTINYLGVLTGDVRLSVVAVPDVPVAYGGSKVMICNANLRFVSPDRGIQADGRVSKKMDPSTTYHTNKIRFIINHQVGYKVKISVFLEHYKV